MPTSAVQERYHNARLFKVVIQGLGSVRVVSFDPGTQERDHTPVYEAGSDSPVAILDGAEKEITLVISRNQTNDHAFEDWWAMKDPRAVTVQTLAPDTKGVSIGDQFVGCKPKAYKRPNKLDAKDGKDLMEELTLTALRKKITTR